VLSVRKLQALLAPVLALALFAPTAGTPIAAASSMTQVVLDSTQKIHPLLQYGEQADPTELVRVIVQKTKADVKTDALLARLPGVQVTEEFSVIPAFVATLPQAAVGTLAANPNVRYISPDGAVQVIPAHSVKGLKPSPNPRAPRSVPQSKRGIDARNLLTSFPIDTGAASAWSMSDGHPETGSGIAVAIIDSGVDASHPDLSGQVLAVNVNRNSQTASDGFGHGTHVAGIINGHDADQRYLGIAPNATLISIKVADDNGASLVSDLLRGLEWVAKNRDTYKIRALNLSASVSFPESYATSPVDAAVEHLWNDGVVVVASAGNLGSDQDAVWYAPGNDPLVITVGCLDENQTAAPGDDSLCSISSRGITEDGFAKPDLIAPGRKIMSVLGEGINGRGVALAGEYPDRISADGRHIHLSGTSMSAPMVTGAVALLLDRHDNLTPGQIKQLLVTNTRTYPGQEDDAGALNITAALAASDHPLPKGNQVPLPVGGAAPPHGAVTVLWDGARWTNSVWNGARWTGAYWDGARWTGAQWDGARWTGAALDGARWTGAYWDGARWTGARWTGARWTHSASPNNAANFN
jgi:serine protease AprX